MTSFTARSIFSYFSTFNFLWFVFVLRGQWLPYKDLSVHCSLLHANLCRPVYAFITEGGVVWTAARKEIKHQSTVSEGILLISVSIFKLCPVFLCPLLDTQRELFTSASDMTSGVLESRSRSQIPGQDPVEPA